MRNLLIGAAALLVLALGGYFVMRPEVVVHTAVQKPQTPTLLATTEYAGFDCKVSMKIADGIRVITSNGVPKHKVGLFSTPLQEQSYEISLPAKPQKAAHSTHMPMPGYTVAGVPFKPVSGLYFQNDKQLGWRYEALSGALELPIDTSAGTVNGKGTYSYFGAPTGLLQEIGVSPDKHSGLVGWAMDGFPIYAYYGYENGEDTGSPIVEMTSSYQLKTGQRPAEKRQPGGTYDGTFTADWKYVDGSGVLDNCNGRFTKTPEFPDGTYAYFLTKSFPVVPRCLWGKLN